MEPLLRKLHDAGLKLTEKFHRFKVWVFAWDEWQDGRRAESLCVELTLDDRASSLFTSCEPDYLLHPAHNLDLEHDTLDRREQTFEPLASGCMIGRRVGQDWNWLAQGPGNRRPQGSRRGVDILEGRARYAPSATPRPLPRRPRWISPPT